MRSARPILSSRALPALALAGVVMVGCSSAINNAPTTTAVSTTVVPVTSPPPTVSAPVTASDSTAPGTINATSTTVPVSSTTLPATTTAAPPPAFLRLSGAGASAFGDPAAVVLPTLIKALGTPTQNETHAYPTLQADGTYLTADGELGYVAPKGREVCWRIGFCADFGGSSASTFEFTGWSYGSDATKALRSRSGVSIGTRWSEVPRISLGSPVCNGFAPATVDGITLKVESKGAPLDQNPHHEDVSVVTMTAGEVPQFQFSDC
jgi:hypothetical protein